MKKLSIKGKMTVIALLVILFTLVGSVVFYNYGLSATSSKNEEVVVNVPSGSTGNDIIDILEKNDLLKVSFCAKIHLKLNDYNFKSNAYLLNKNMNTKEIFKAIEGNDNKYISNTKITVLDGQTIPEYAKTIAKQTGIKYEDIINKWNYKNYLKSLIKDYWFLTDDILNNDIYYPLEGYLAPETYFLSQDDDIESITKMLLNQTKKNLDKYKNKISDFTINNKKVSIHEFITLSSIVQRESSGHEQDRKLICGVLLNRLNKPMPLQCDVTVNYGNQVVKIDVKHADLNTDTKYNTYKYMGLPVGAISSISTDIIESVLNYKESDYYYFFATADGKVLYAKTYQEHQENVKNNKWY